MKYIIILTIISLWSSCKDISPDGSYNIIIVINGNILTESIRNPYFEIGLIDGSTEVIEFFYQPGSLSITGEIINKKLPYYTEYITMSFDHYQGDSNFVNYQIEFNPRWLFERYTVIHIYNLDNEEYARIFFPLDDGRNYTFEVNTPTPSLSFRRARRVSGD